jgi:hypothetical protein
MSDEEETEYDKVKRKLNFSETDDQKVKTLIENLYYSLKWRRINELMKVSKTARDGKLVDFLKEEIDKDRFHYIYFYNQFAKQMRDLYDGKTESDHGFLEDKKKYKENLHLKSVINPIEGVLENNEFFKVLLEIENDPEVEPLTFDKKIAMFNKYNKISFMRMKIKYANMIEDVKTTCEKILEIVGEPAKNPEYFPYFMRFVINTVHIAETDAVEYVMENKKIPQDSKGFLKPFFDIFDKFSNMGTNINVTIKKPVKIEGFPNESEEVPNYSEEVPNYSEEVPNYSEEVPNYSEEEKTGGSNRENNMYDKNIMPKKIVICSHKSEKKCARAYVSCKKVNGKNRKYCRRTTQKSIAKYYANKRK